MLSWVQIVGAFDYFRERPWFLYKRHDILSGETACKHRFGFLEIDDHLVLFRCHIVHVVKRHPISDTHSIEFLGIGCIGSYDSKFGLGWGYKDWVELFLKCCLFRSRFACHGDLFEGSRTIIYLCVKVDCESIWGLIKIFDKVRTGHCCEGWCLFKAHLQDILSGDICLDLALKINFHLMWTFDVRDRASIVVDGIDACASLPNSEHRAKATEFKACTRSTSGLELSVLTDFVGPDFILRNSVL